MHLLKPTDSGNHLFPVFLKLHELQTLLVGAGNVGLEKISAMLKNSPNARIKVVSESVSHDFERLAARFSNVEIFNRSFRSEDLDGVDLVVVATNDATVNKSIKQEARKRRLLVNVADKPELCDFYLGSIVQKGELKIGISTNGKSPTVAKRLKEVLSEALPDELEAVLSNLNVIRQKLSGDFSEKVRKLNEITRILIASEKEGF